MFRGKKSFFLELFISFLVLLCIPTITIVLLLWNSTNIVKEQVQDIENKRQHLYVEQIEEMMENMKDICHAIYTSEYCELYASEIGSNSSWAYDLRVRVKNMLQSMYKSSYYDIFIYYDANRIVSAKNASLKAEDYYATYYSKGKVDLDLRLDFLDVLRTDSEGIMCHVINVNTSNSFICMTMRVRNSPYTICVVLRPSYLERLLVMQTSGEDAIFIVYNGKKQLLFSNNPEIKETQIDKLASLEEVDPDTWLDNNDYMTQINQSKVLDNYYVYSVSKDLFWNTLRMLRIFGYTGMLLCICISFYLAYRSAMRAYKPVDNIMEILKRKKWNNEQEKGISEFSHIVSFVEQQDKALKEKQKISQEWFLHGLLEGKKVGASSEEYQQNSIEFSGEYFAVCVISVDSFSSGMKDLCGFAVQNVMEELCNTIGKAYFVELAENRYALIVNMFDEISSLKDALIKGQEFLRTELQIYLSIGYSDIYKEIHSIPEAYMEAKEAIRYRFLLGSGRIIGYDEIKIRSAGYRKDDKSKVYISLLEYIEHKQDRVELNDFVKQLMHIYQMNEEMSIDATLAFMNEILSALGDILILCGHDEESSQEVLTQLKNTSTLSEFWQKLSEQIAELCKCEIKRKHSVDIVVETKHFIDEKYSDPDLSVSSVGSAIGMQGNHLSKLFKERYGVTILEYLTTVRINQAKKLISEGKMTVQEVSEKTGFLSSTVFIRTFKKKEGITPGKYKEITEEKK